MDRYADNILRLLRCPQRLTTFVTLTHEVSHEIVSSRFVLVVRPPRSGTVFIWTARFSELAVYGL